MNIFGELTDDWAEKKKYALYKTVDIMKCLKEGRQPVPGPPGGFKGVKFYIKLFHIFFFIV